MQRYVALPSAIEAAVLIGARRILSAEGRDGRLPETAEEACERLGASTTQAYAMLARLYEVAPTLRRSAGRPARAPATEEERRAVLDAVVEFLMDHPGAVLPRESRRIYRDVFRRFVVGLRAPESPGSRMNLETLSGCVHVPLGTLKGWMAGGDQGGSPAEGAGAGNEDGEEREGEDATCSEPSGAGDPASEETAGEVPLSTDPSVVTVLAEYPAFAKRRLGEFVRHLREVHGIRFSRNQLSALLAAAGLRPRPPRKKRGEAPWSEGTFKRNLFPGAQWLGDGKKVSLELDGVHHDFNLEGILDVGSDALLAACVTDVEDAAAVREAFAEATAEAGEPPLGLCLDNRPSNHTPEVQNAVAPAELVRTTPGHPQAKAPLEGAFGLLAQTVPALVVGGSSPRELARSILKLLLVVWAWTRNHRPRPRHRGRTPAAIYRQRDPPGPEEVQAALAHLRILRERAERARQTLEARADPLRRALLVEELGRLGIQDPEDRLALRLSRYSREAIRRGLAIFIAKRAAETLPSGADSGPYLGGIIRRVDEELETLAISRELLRLRLRAGELTRDFLVVRLRKLEGTTTALQLPSKILEEALTATTELDFDFWLTELRRALDDLAPSLRRALHNGLVQKVAATHELDRRRRLDLLAELTRAEVRALAA